MFHHDMDNTMLASVYNNLHYVINENNIKKEDIKTMCDTATESIQVIQEAGKMDKALINNLAALMMTMNDMLSDVMWRYSL